MATTRTAAVIAVVLACALALAGCAGVANETRPSGTMAAGSARLSDGDSGKTTELTIGGTLVIDLEENVTTGYSWALDGSVPGVLALVGEAQESAAATGVVGAAGRHRFTYEAAKAGEGDLALVYVRPWEKGVAPAKTFTVHVVVK